MAVTCGFYNALNHDRKYNAEELSRIFDGVIRDGVYMSIGDKFTVTQSSGITVNVGTGRAWFDHTWTNNDADLPVKMEESELVLDRIDAIVIEVNASEEVRNNTIKAVKGTPSSQPTKPVMVETEFIHQHPLAYVTRRHGSTTITNSDIEIAVGKSECPYVTSILEAADISELFTQWDSQFNDWKNAQEASFESWSEDEKNEYQTWSEAQKEMFTVWFEGIKGQLGDDAAGSLQLQINDKGIQVYTHSRSGNVNNFQGTGPNGRALMTANIQTGDTFTVNGSPVTAYMGADLAIDAMAGSAYNGKWVTFVFQDGILNFKGGGGAVTVTGLDAAAVKTGTTIVVKQGAKELQRVVGTFTSDATATASQIRKGATAYVKGAKITGNIADYGPQTIVPTTRDQSFGPGVYLAGQITVKGDSNLLQENILKGKSIFGVSGKLQPLVCLTMSGLEGYNGWYINSSGAIVRPNAGGALSIITGGKIKLAKLTFTTAVGMGFNLDYNVGGNTGTINSNGEFRELNFSSFISNAFTTNLVAHEARYLSLVVLGSI